MQYAKVGRQFTVGLSACVLCLHCKSFGSLGTCCLIIQPHRELLAPVVYEKWIWCIAAEGCRFAESFRSIDVVEPKLIIVTAAPLCSFPYTTNASKAHMIFIICICSQG